MTRNRHDPLDPSAAREHAQFARRLARQLVRDEALADDLAQDAWLSAMRQPPDDGRAWRAWLRTVVRRAARFTHRSEMRRQRREQAIAERRGSSSASTLDVVAETERIRRLAAAVAELGERNRDVVFLRYYEGLPPRDIARRLGISVDATKARLKRSLAELRAKLDAEHDGDRSAWCVAFASWLVPSMSTVPSATIAKGIALMTAKTKIGVGAAGCALLLVLGWWLSSTIDSVATEPAPSESSSIAGASRIDRADLPDLLVPEIGRKQSKSDGVAVADANEAEAPFALATITGRVVDGERRPVAGIRVAVQLDQSYEVTSGDDGRFTVPGIRRSETDMLEGCIVARDPGRRLAAVHTIRIRSREMRESQPLFGPFGDPDHELEVGTVTLVPAVELAIEVVSGTDRVARVPVEVFWGRERRLADHGRTDERGVVQCLLPPADVAVRAAMPPLSGSATRDAIAWDAAGERLTVELTPARPLSVRVVDAATGATLPGARVTFSERFETHAKLIAHSGFVETRRRPVRGVWAETDERGTAYFPDLPSDVTWFAHAAKPGFRNLEAKGTRFDSAGPRVDDFASELTIDLVPVTRRTVRFPNVEQAPPSGSILELRPQPGRFTAEWQSPPTSAVVMDNEIIVEGVDEGHFGALAVAPSGAIARLFAKAGSTTGEPTRFHPARTVIVNVRDIDRMPVRGAVVTINNRGNNLLADPQMTDELGVVRFEELYAGTASVSVYPRGATGVVDGGHVDLRAGDAKLDVIVPSSGLIEFRTWIDGEARLPASYRVRLSVGGLLDSAVVEEDAVAGTFVARVLLDERLDEVQGYLNAEGFRPVRIRVPRTEIVSEDVAEGDAPATLVDLELRRESGILVHLRAEADFRPKLVLERWLERIRSWESLKSHLGSELRRPNTKVGAYLFAGMDSGRYRIRDTETDSATAAIEIDDAGGGELIDVDLVIEDRSAASVEELAVERGSIRIILAAAHPPEQTGAVDALVVTLLDVDGRATRLGPQRVAVADGGALVEDIEPGEYTLFVDPGEGFAPIEVDHVRVVADVAGAESAVVNLSPFSTGTTFRVRVLHDPGTTAPPLWIGAACKSGVPYFRSIRSRGGDEVVLQGLGRGRFHVGVVPQSSHLDNRELWIDVDGTGEHEYVFDVRNPNR